jgi:hypothetical protein
MLSPVSLPYQVWTTLEPRTVECATRDGEGPTDTVGRGCQQLRNCGFEDVSPIGRPRRRTFLTSCLVGLVLGWVAGNGRQGG